MLLIPNASRSCNEKGERKKKKEGISMLTVKNSSLTKIAQLGAAKVLKITTTPATLI